ncbi:MAG: 50S ribosomal protein L11 methyltransferase [Alphaproteobacteria bacterium]|jgi:ribosomal protein L11 methyltransferase|nr:50S ribosomal protein L11 methyltransferase [Alphaproteobacteria bacterium]MDP6517708.1 50S ribosomal protein L11 methyltransferase [Alphaproteobacteria bacterium]
MKTTARNAGTAAGADALFRISLTLPGHALVPFEAKLGPVAMAVSTTRQADHWRLDALWPAAPDPDFLVAALNAAAEAAGIGVPVADVSPVPELDWVREGLKGLDAVRAGRITVKGSHLPVIRVPGRIVVEIDAGPAFGTGHHATTLGCLLALDRLARARRFRRVLDLGCGAGVLALAAAKLWRARVLAVDIDPIAVATTAANTRRNRLSGAVRARVSNGYRAQAIRAGAPFDLIVANLLSEPLANMAPALARHLAPDGTAILSGILARQEPRVLGAHRGQGLALIRRLRIDGWHTLVLGRARSRGLSLPGPPPSLGLKSRLARERP